MITGKLGWREVLYGTPKFVLMKLGRRPFTVYLEVTKNCGLRCNFCDYWQTGKETRLDDYAAILKKLDPLTLVITGGEPMIRKDLPELIARIKAELQFIKETLGHWREFTPGTVKPTDCTDCWYACRGETEAPLGIRRILELNT